VNGKVLLISGRSITEVEDKMDNAQLVWLGPQLDKPMREVPRPTFLTIHSPHQKIGLCFDHGRSGGK
jgi:hypothetical protein